MSIIQNMGPLNVVHYEPGVCNIGPAEIARRRRFGHLGLIASVILLGGLVATGVPHPARLLLVLTVGGSASGYLQARFHFCAGFGSAGVYNLGPLGTTVPVSDLNARARDRAKAMQIGLASLAIGVVVAVAAVLLPF